MATQRSMRVSDVPFSACLVVVSSSNRSRTENAIQVMCIGLLLNPFPDGIEHISMDLEALISQSWVMENAKNIVHYLINRYSRVFPCIDHTPGKVNG